ncbi:hypothetical protein QBC39DRAFT_333900 [Podospora conica]|nr:hypothetical protein QBC39DRAFT_333900 [Schizothecium conicum]
MLRRETRRIGVARAINARRGEDRDETARVYLRLRKYKPLGGPSIRGIKAGFGLEGYTDNRVRGRSGKGGIEVKYGITPENAYKGSTTAYYDGFETTTEARSRISYEERVIPDYKSYRGYGVTLRPIKSKTEERKLKAGSRLGAA